MVEITWLGHSTFQLKLESGEVVLTDPWLEGNPKHPHGFEIRRVDVILASHGHFDHFADVRSLAQKFSAKVVGIYELCSYLESKGVSTAMGMNKGGTQKVGPLSVTMTNAFHSSSLMEDNKLWYAGDAAGFVVEVPDGRSFYFAGDTCVFGDMQLIAAIYKPELCFLPIGDLYTMGPREAAHACRLMRPRKVIPMHYATFPPLTGTPEKLSELIKDLPETSVWKLEPGKPVEW